MLRRPLVSLLFPAIACASFFAADAHADPSSTSPQQGYDLGEIQSPRELGMGGAQNALGAGTSAIYMNPANLAQSRVYHFEGIAAFSPDARRQSYGGAVADSSTSKLAGGFGGTWNQLDPDGIDRKWTDLRLSLAYPISDRVLLGMTGRYLHVNQSIAQGPLGASKVSDGTPDGPVFNNFTFDAGVSVLPVDGLAIGLVGHNLTAPGNGLAPTTLATGIGYQSHVVAIEADGMADFTTWQSTRLRAMIGGELFLADHFPIRVGYRYDDGQKAHALSAGIGYIDKKFSVELSGRRDIVADHPMTLFVLGLRYFYDSGSDDEGAGLDAAD
ncbi:MAG TPA: hypothetical protein VF407_13360, partial [Polyangiaceae bacterium]